MVHEKMKLKILEKISKDLYVHIDQVFAELLLQQKTDYKLQNVIDFYLSDQNKEKDIIQLSNKTSEVVGTKRDLVFIFYNLCCPFYRELGVNGYFSKDKREEICKALGITRWNIHNYLLNAKHQYRFYADYRELIDKNLKHHLEYNR